VVHDTTGTCALPEYIHVPLGFKALVLVVRIDITYIIKSLANLLVYSSAKISSLYHFVNMVNDVLFDGRVNTLSFSSLSVEWVFTYLATYTCIG